MPVTQPVAALPSANAPSRQQALLPTRKRNAAPRSNYPVLSTTVAAAALVLTDSMPFSTAALVL